MPIHRAVVDAGIAGEFAQADRFNTLRLEPLKRCVYKRFRQISMAKGVALRRRFCCHGSVPPTDFAAIYQPLTAKRSFPYMSPSETIRRFKVRRFKMTGDFND